MCLLLHNYESFSVWYFFVNYRIFSKQTSIEFRSNIWMKDSFALYFLNIDFNDGNIDAWARRFLFSRRELCSGWSQNFPWKEWKSIFQIEVSLFIGLLNKTFILEWCIWRPHSWNASLHHRCDCFHLCSTLTLRSLLVRQRLLLCDNQSEPLFLCPQIRLRTRETIFLRREKQSIFNWFILFSWNELFVRLFSVCAYRHDESGHFLYVFPLYWIKKEWTVFLDDI